MKEQIAVQKLLHEKLSQIQRTNPRYSLRSYSKKVGIHVGALSGIMNGQRNISRKLAERIAERLMLDPQERSELLRLFPLRKFPKKADGEKLTPKYLAFNAAQFKIAAEWEHFAVMSLLNCSDFKSETAWIAGRLGLTETRVKQVVDRLLQLGLFEIDSNGNLKRTKQGFRTPDDVADLSLKKCHEQTLDLAKESLYRDPVEKRDFTSATMAIDPKKIRIAKEILRKCTDDLADLLESGNQTEVYRLSMQLFPLSKLDGVEK